MARVFDGDTLQLTTGRRVRLAGIDTPELGHDRQPAEAYAESARQRLEYIVSAADQRIRLQPARDPEDRYGRLLAHAFTPNGVGIQTLLLQDGLALALIQPPNLSRLDCYRDAERRARARKAGLWRDLPTPTDRLDPAQPGLALLRGRVVDTRNTRRSVWIELQDRVSLRIARDDLRRYPFPDPDDLAGRSLEVRGWLYRYRGRPTLRVHHPAALRLLPD